MHPSRRRIPGCFAASPHLTHLPWSPPLLLSLPAKRGSSSATFPSFVCGSHGEQGLCNLFMQNTGFIAHGD